MDTSNFQTRNNLEAFLGHLKFHGRIKGYQIRDHHVMVAISPGYVSENPEHGYDDETKDLVYNLDQSLAGFDLKLSDAGFEEDGSGEYFLYR